MIKIIITSLIGAIITVSGFLGIEKINEPISNGNQSLIVGGISDPFLSIQLAESPENGECLTTDGTSNAWGTCATGGSGSPGGSNTQVQFNDASNFGGDAGFTYSKSADRATLTYASTTYATFATGALFGNTSATTSRFASNGDLYIGNAISPQLDAFGTKNYELQITGNINDAVGIVIGNKNTGTSALDAIVFTNNLTPQGGIGALQTYWGGILYGGGNWSGLVLGLDALQKNDLGLVSTDGNLVLGAASSSSASAFSTKVGNIVFNTGAGSLTDEVPDAIFTWDNKFGLGTTSPYAKLSVVGEAVASHFTATTTTNTSRLPLLTVSTVLTIPAAANPTANDPGELAHDTSDNQLILDDFVIAKGTQKIWSVTVASTSPAFITGGLLKIPTELDGYTVTAIRCSVQDGTSKVIAVEDEAGNSSEDITCTTSVTSDDGSITNATYTAAEEAYIDFGNTSGSVNYVSVSVFGTWTRE